jgi:transglutaminase-like putative cysteine protease
MHRRTIIKNGVFLSAALATGHVMTATRPDDQPTPDNLKSTALVEASHPRIVALAKEITADAGSDSLAAVRIHDWVRDQILFGIPPSFYDTTATATLDVKVGYCNSKATLFSALLRARAIATRLRVVELSAEVLQGLFDPGTPYVDHAFTEVFLGGGWIQVDSYVVDRPLAVAAKKKLSLSASKAGFGVHVDGNPNWDGRSNNFIQYMDNNAVARYVLRDHGVFADIADFYQKTQATRNRKNLLSGLGIRLGAASINSRIQRIRTEVG